MISTEKEQNFSFSTTKHKLVLAEKPSVAQSIAKVLGAESRQDGFLVGNGYIVSWCIGHLVELAHPDCYDARYAKWRKEDLPILPRKWQYQVSSSTQKQFQILSRLMLLEDVESLICATDAGREGELIFRLVYHQCGCRKPFQRLWISSMEDSAIREGFANLKPGSEYDALYEAALCRERADWIVGINATRLFSCLYGTTLNVGRVMTPTLGMTVQREAAISAFVPEPYYTVHLDMGGWNATSQRFKEKAAAEAVLKHCTQAVVQNTDRAEKSEKPPALYDLTTLQRDANRLLGYTAMQTLDYAQNLYEKKLITYPRTDSRFLTEDSAQMLPDLVSTTAAVIGIQDAVPVCASQVINSNKVSDHHAILPTRELGKYPLDSLPQGEQEVLRLISMRLICAVEEVHQYAETVVTLICAGAEFTAKGKSVLQLGWKAFEKGSTEESPVLPELLAGAVLPITDAKIKAGKTAPPKHFTEDLLLQAMETASAEEFPEGAERKGIGTPATRAGIIEKLVQKGFLERRGSGKVKNLIPTEKGKALITVTPEQIQSPSMTADWEEKLMQIEHGTYSPDSFMDEITDMITELMTTYELTKGANTLMAERNVIGNCPHCGAEVVLRQKGWFCANWECRFVLWKDNAYFGRLGKHLTEQMASQLVQNGRIRLKECRSQKTGKSYNAIVLMSTEADGRAKFQMEFDNGGKKT